MTDTDISIFLPSLAGGGAEKMMIDLAGAFADAGHQVEVVVAETTGPFVDRLSDDVRLVDLDAPAVPGYELMGAVPSLRQHLRRTRPSALLSALNRANIVAVVASRLARTETRVVVSERNHLSTYLEHAPTKEALALPRLVRVTYPFADRIIAISEGVADDLAATTGLDRTSMDVVYNPALSPDIVPRSRQPLDHPWLNEDVPVLLGVGSLTRQKDFPTLVRTLARVREDHPARLIILGEGEERDRIEATARDYGVADHVDLPGFVDNPYAYMRRADVFVLSSEWEGFGNVVVEAMACGCPVVSTDCPSGPREILDGGEYGPLVPVGDSETLADAVVRTLDDPPSPSTLEARAQDFALETVVEEYLELLVG